MITYVNTVLVGKGLGVASNANVAGKDTKAAAIAEAGKFIVDKIDDSKFRVGLITNKVVEAYIKGKHTYSPVVKWSNDIKVADIKGLVKTTYTPATEDVVKISFDGAKALPTLAEGGKRVILRITYKDLPTRYRKWSESYEYVTAAGDTAADIAEGLKNQIVKNYKRARIEATLQNQSKDLVLTAMPYDDDETVDSISPANKVRFTANVWYTDPSASGFASKNKYAVGCVIKKTPGIAPVGDWKLVRDAEAQAMGYAGILNRGECTWPIIKPEMNVDPSKSYDTITLEFENMYRAADDIFRKTKQTLQIYEVNNGSKAAGSSKIDEIYEAIVAAIQGSAEDSIEFNNFQEMIAPAAASTEE